MLCPDKQVHLDFQVNTELIRNEEFNGKMHTVMPVVAAVEGVLNQELLLAEELRKSLHSWEGVVVTMDHPMRDGQPISANEKDALEAYAVGHFFNARVDDSSLKGEIWVENESIQTHAIGPVFNERIENGDVVDVSTGYFRKFHKRTGVFNGKKYNSVAYDIVPNHLAILVDKKGACSVDDGCGTPRVNEQEQTMVSKFKAYIEDFLGALASNREMGFNERARHLREAVVNRNPVGDKEYLGVIEVYDSHVVYFRENFDSSEVKIYSQDYSINDDGTVILDGERKEVRQVVTYEPVQNEESSGVIEDAGEIISNEESAMENRDQMIQDLAANEQIPFDADQLSAMDDAGLAFVANSLKVEEPTEPEVTANEEVTESQDETVATALDPAVISKLNELGADGIDQVLSGISQAQQNAQAERESVITALTANAAIGLNADEMALLPTDTLKRIARDASVDYTALVGGTNEPVVNEQLKAPAPPAVVLAAPVDA